MPTYGDSTSVCKAIKYVRKKNQPIVKRDQGGIPTHLHSDYLLSHTQPFETNPSRKWLDLNRQSACWQQSLSNVIRNTCIHCYSTFKDQAKNLVDGKSKTDLYWRSHILRQIALNEIGLHHNESWRTEIQQYTTSDLVLKKRSV